jgi:hypothetical protein
MDQRTAEAFIKGYRATFESMDVPAITDRFVFPCHVAGQAGEVSVTSVPDATAWTASIERIVGAYRVIGIASAAIESLRVVGVTPGIAHAVVRWGLRDAVGGPVYSFTASYTLVDTADGARIAAIVHDEGPKLQMALAKSRAGRPA